MASPGMVSTVTTSSVGSEAARAVVVTEERKRKRKESNRLSAQRSRERKKRQTDELAAQVAALRARNGAMVAAADEAARRCAAVEAENELLRARSVELGASLQSLIDLIQCMDVAAAFTSPIAGVGGAVLPQQPLLDAGMYYNYY